MHYPPPPAAVAAAVKLLSDPATVAAVSSYGPNLGIDPLREALREKVARVNGLEGYDICVTHGAAGWAAGTWGQQQGPREGALGEAARLARPATCTGPACQQRQ